MDPSMLIDYDEEDDFEDANGDEISIGSEVVSQDNQMRKIV